MGARWGQQVSIIAVDDCAKLQMTVEVAVYVMSSLLVSFTKEKTRHMPIKTLLGSCKSSLRDSFVRIFLLHYSERENRR